MILPKDVLVGGPGDGVLNALDLQGGDTLNCGTGKDKSIGDWNDIFNANCRPTQ